MPFRSSLRTREQALAIASYNIVFQGFLLMLSIPAILITCLIMIPVHIASFWKQ